MALAYEPGAREAVVFSAWVRTLNGSAISERTRHCRSKSGASRTFPSSDSSLKTRASLWWTSFRRRHPWRVRLFATILGWGNLRSETAVREFVRSRPFVSFRPTRAAVSEARVPPSPDLDPSA